ncbi:L-rhamnose mutarotase [Sphingomonas sp. PAMC 26605]|uniref:L-rhamnose mutarotase n=1 Tax=Sphingomonas sp. PAMC 26605 TaxID=1112214 RepID=UPI00026CB17B|nr:L-rhamnose mutarotase [Sphingomonas sp. PAMC 26605]
MTSDTFLPDSGAVSAAPGRRTRHVLVLDLHDDPEAIAAYRHWHRPGGPPAAVTRAIRADGIATLEIWQVGDRLVMLMETTPDFDPAAKAVRDATDPEIQAWETLMDRFQRRLRFAAEGEKWVTAEQIYALEDQP